MKHEILTSNVDSTGVSEWWFTRNILVGLFGIAASISLSLATNPEPTAHSGADPTSPSLIAAQR